MKTNIDKNLPEAVIRMMIFIILITSSIIQQVVSHRTYLMQVKTDYRDIKKGCGYEGYDPYYTTEITKMRHHTASLELNAIDSAFVSADMAIAYGVMSSGKEAFDSSESGQWTDYTKKIMHKAKESWKESFKQVKAMDAVKGIKFSKWAGSLLKGTAKTAAVMSPVLGIFVSAMDAATAVKTPTHEDILNATNKALKRIVKEIDTKMTEVKKFAKAEDMKNEVIRDTKLYQYLLKEWMACGTEYFHEKDKILACQQRTYGTIKNRDHYFINQKFNRNGWDWDVTPDEDDRRRIEMNMVNFREYALLSLLSLKTLTASYDLDRQLNIDTDRDSNNTSFSLCKEMYDVKKKNENEGIDYSHPPLLFRYCEKFNELKSQARYFEAYGKAAVEEIIKLAESRTNVNLEYDSQSKNDDIKLARKKIHEFTSSSTRMTHAECDGQLHPSKIERCKYSIDVVGEPELGERYGYITNKKEKKNSQWIDMINNKVTARYTKWETTDDNREYYEENGALKLCRDLVKNRQRDYKSLEQWEIINYWDKEVMKLVKCGRMLVDDIVKDCSEATLRNFTSLFEQVIKFTKTSGSEGITHFDRAADGLISTTTKVYVDTHSSRGQIPAKLKKNPYWTGELEKKVNVTEIKIYIDKHDDDGSNQIATGIMKSNPVIKGISKKMYGKKFDADLVFRRPDGNFVFVNNMGNTTEYRIVVLTTNNGLVIKEGTITKDLYLHGFENGEGTWYDERKWGDGYHSSHDYASPFVIEDFKGYPTGNFSGLKVEVGTKDATDTLETIEWELCREFPDLKDKLPFIEDPLEVKCNGVFTDVNAIKITVTDDEPAELMLAEVIVIGIPPAEEGPDETMISFEKAKQSSQSRTDGGSALEAFDGYLDTFSETKETEEQQPWWRGEFDAEAEVKEIWLHLAEEITEKYHKQRGYCLKSNGEDQNAEIHKFDGSLSGDLRNMQELCLAKCVNHLRATGCELSGDHTCIAHKGDVYKGSGDEGYFCWIFEKPIEEIKKNDHKEKGYCLKSDGEDQNSGVHKFDESLSGSSTNKQKSCLAKCVNYLGATGCELSGHTCAVHTRDVAKGSGNEGSFCWIIKKHKEKYEMVKVEVSRSGSDDWKHCGGDDNNIDGHIIKRDCDTSTDPVKYVRITGQRGRSLKIKEVVALGHYIDKDNRTKIDELEKLGKDSIDEVEKRLGSESP